MNEREKMREREKARDFVRSLSRSEVGELGDELVLGGVDYHHWFGKRPSSVFMTTVDEERIRREIRDE